MSAQPPDTDQLAALAQRFVEGKLFDEAVQLLEMAVRLDPRNVGLQLSLAQAKQLRRDAPSSAPTSVRERIRRDCLDAKHFLGLAYLYADRGEEELARTYTDLAIAKDQPNPVPHKLAARLSLRRGELARARKELETARRFNPFDREVAELLAHTLGELGKDAESLAAWIDAFLLLPPIDRERSSRIKEEVQRIRERLGWTAAALTRLFRERQEAIDLAFDRLEWHRERFAEHGVPPILGLGTQRGSRRFELAARLRGLDTWSHLTDDEIFALTPAAREDVLGAGEILFENAAAGEDFFVLESGEVTIRRPTPYGEFPLGLIKPGDLFGEMAYLTRAPRSGEAVATQPSRVLRLEADVLDRIVRQQPALGVKLYWSFWHGLAFKLRCTNEQLRGFFGEEATGGTLLQPGRPEGGVEAPGDSESRLELLREQGLSGEELGALATFSKERTYPGGTVLFAEGEEGREMFIVVEGKVRISKQIAGAGEEALAILGRGEFFGEMSLIDGQPRSADARAHGGPVRVIALEQATLRDVLGAEPTSSLELLQLLCRLIAKRLREVDEKVTSWRIMAGQQSVSA